MKENKAKLLRRLFDEIDRVSERFENNEDALEALQAIKNWGMDEMEPPNE